VRRKAKPESAAPEQWHWITINVCLVLERRGFSPRRTSPCRSWTDFRV